MKREMPPDREPRRPATFAINLEESWQSRWWSEHFGVSPTQLLAAIAAVGVEASAVRKALGK